MTPRELLDAFDVLAEAPNGIARLREMVLQLAVRGKLVPQDPTEEPASAVLERVLSVRTKWFESTELRAPKPSKPLKTTPFDVPAGWSWTQLGRECLVEMGNSPPGVSYNDSNDGVPLINGPVEFSPMPLGPTRRIRFTTSPTKMCQRGDLLVCVRGATTGRTNIAAFDACIGRGVALVRGWEAQEWIYLFMRYVGAELLALGKGTTFPSISYDDLAGKPLPVPPLGEQTRIVARVDELMALIDRFEQARLRRESARVAFRDASLAALRDSETSEELENAWSHVASHLDLLLTHEEDVGVVRDVVHDLAVAGLIVEPQDGDESANAILERAREERRVAGTREPKVMSRSGRRSGWVGTTVESAFLSVTDGDHQAPPKSPTGIPFLVIGNISSGRIDVEGCRRVPTSYFEQLDWTKKPKKGDILFSVTGSLGIAVLVDVDFDFCVQRHIAILKPPRSGHPEFLRLAVSAPRSRRYASAEATGIAQKTLSLAALRSMPLDLPPRAEQRRIVARFAAFESMLSRLDAHLSSARQLSMGLGQAMLSSVSHSPQG